MQVWLVPWKLWKSAYTTTSLHRVVYNSSTRSGIPNRMVLNQEKTTDKVKYSMTTFILVSYCYIIHAWLPGTVPPLQDANTDSAPVQT